MEKERETETEMSKSDKKEEYFFVDLSPILQEFRSFVIVRRKFFSEGKFFFF